MFESQVARTPDEVAIICGSLQITYAELNRRSNQLANLLRGLGIGPDILVGICLERSIDMVVALLGVLKAGGAYVPLDPHFPQERLRFMARDAAIKVVLADEASRELVPIPGAAVLTLDGNRDEIALQSEQLGARAGSAENLAYVIYTSGSTGSPKGVPITHRSVVNFLESMRREPGLTPDDCLLSVTTLSFDIAGLEIFLPLIVGARIVLASRLIGSGRSWRLARLLSDANATVMMEATPATWRMLLDSPGWSGQTGFGGFGAVAKHSRENSQTASCQSVQASESLRANRNHHLVHIAQRLRLATTLCRDRNTDCQYPDLPFGMCIGSPCLLECLASCISAAMACRGAI